MGAAESSQQNKEVNVELGEEFSSKSDVYKLWTRVQSCTRNTAKGTLFLKELDPSSDARQYFENGIKSLRQLRHPCILQYADSSITVTEARLFTERVQALDQCIDLQSPIEIRAGLRSILDALIFLHTTALISHNAVCPSSIFVAPDGSWRLGGMEFARRNGEKKDDHLLLSDFFKAVKPKPFSPPEDQTAMRADHPPFARDVYGLGKLVEYAISFIEKAEEDQDEVLADLRSAVATLCAAPTGERMRLEECRGMPAFCNPLSEVESFVRTIQTKTEEEKQRFFDTLPSLLSTLPPRVIGVRLTRLLMSRYVMLEGRAHTSVLDRLLEPALDNSDGLLPLGLFKETVLPECTRVLRVRELHVRLAILGHFERFAPHFSEEELSECVLEEVLVGLDDADDRVVAATLKAMSVLVRLLGSSEVLGRRRLGAKERSRVFVDGTPKAASAVSSTVFTPTVPKGASSQLMMIPPPRLSEKKKERLWKDESMESLVEEPTRTANTAAGAAREPAAAAAAAAADWNEAGDDAGWNEEWREEEEEEIKDQEEEKEEMVKRIERKEERRGGEIGSEFALKVTVRSEIDDLFAEMQPVIKASSSIVAQLEELAAKSEIKDQERDQGKSEGRKEKEEGEIKDQKEEERGETKKIERLTFTGGEETSDAWDAEVEWGLDED